MKYVFSSILYHIFNINSHIFNAKKRHWFPMLPIALILMIVIILLYDKILIRTYFCVRKTEKDTDAMSRQTFTSVSTTEGNPQSFLLYVHYTKCDSVMQ